MSPGEFFGNVLAVFKAKLALREATVLGPRARVWGRVTVKNYGRLILGERLRLVGNITPTELVVGRGGELEIGDGVFINHGVSIAASLRVTIGRSATIGPSVFITDNDFHRLEPERRNEAPESRPVTIGENVWLGLRVIVLPGVTIGDHTVVGAGSIVTRDLPPRVLAAGVPARVIRSLDD